MPDAAPRETDREALDILIRGFQVSRMIRLVADLNVADEVGLEGRDIHSLAQACAVIPTQLLRVLRALAAFEIFRVTADGRVEHSPRSLLLRTDTPNSMHHGAKFWTGAGSWRAWGELDVALQGGVPHEAAWGIDRFEYLRGHPEEGRQFDLFMANFPDNRHQAVAEAYDFSGAELITDIGGGNGEALRRILTNFPQCRGVLFDRPDVVQAIAQPLLQDGKISPVGGNFFDGVPAGANIYLLIRVLHDWSDADCVRILQNCRGAMKSSSRLLVVEQILEPDPLSGRQTSYLVDTQMMAMFGSARERTKGEFDELLAASGLTSLRLLATTAPVWIHEVAVQ